MLIDPDSDGIYARVAASPGRRFVALVMLYGLGTILAYLAFNSRAGVSGVIILAIFAGGAFWAAERMRRGTDGELQLTADALMHSDGTLVAPLDGIQSVSRGAFALKPSNGFTLVLKEPLPRAWKLGLWWRWGRRVGVGGVVNAGAAKFMAEQIAMRVANENRT